LVSFAAGIAASLEDADTTMSRKWARLLRPFRTSAGVDTEVEMESERRDARVEW
jgi:hypothetical protein